MFVIGLFDRNIIRDRLEVGNCEFFKSCLYRGGRRVIMRLYKRAGHKILAFSSGTVFRSAFTASTPFVHLRPRHFLRGKALTVCLYCVKRMVKRN